MQKITTLVAVGLAAALTLSGCAANEGGPGGASGSAGGTITGKGASSMKAAQEKWIADFQSKHAAVTINYSPDGSGAGRESFISGAVDFAGSDRALKDAEMGPGKFGKCASTANALNLPVFVSPIAVAFKVDGVSELKLDAETTASIFKGTIAKWNDPKIAALNPGAKLPDAAITAVHRSDDSGTTENFVDYLSKAAPSIWTDKVSGVWPAAIKGEAAKGTAGVIAVIENSKNAIGYAEEAQAKARGLGLAQIKVGNEFFGPTAEAAGKIVDAAKRVEGRSADDYALSLDRKASGVYPIALVSYAIVCEQYKDAKTGTMIRDYLTYLVSAEGQQAAQKAAGAAPLSADYQKKLAAAVAKIK